MMFTNVVRRSRLLQHLCPHGQRRYSQLLSYNLHSYRLSTLQMCRDFHSTHLEWQRTMYMDVPHERRILYRFINVPTFYFTKNSSVKPHQRIPFMQNLMFSSSSIEISSITSTSQTGSDNDVATSSASIPSSRATSKEAKQSPRMLIGDHGRRRRRKRRKLTSTDNDLLLSLSPTATTANSKLIIMEVMKRRRRRREQQAPTGTERLSKAKRRLVSSDPQSTWNMNIRKIQKIVQQIQQQNPNKKPLSIRNMIPRDKRLRKWLAYLRCEYQKMLQGRKNKLTEARFEILRSYGFSDIVAPMLVSWDARYKQLLQFLKKYEGKYPHELKSTLTSDELDLYHWCNRQRILRKAYMAKKLSKTMHINDERIARLDEINFLWSVNNLHWQERYDELKVYYRTHGNCMVPARWVGNRPLARWVETQRRQYTLLKQNKPSQLTPERMQLLEELEFEWDPYEVRWLERYNELLEFQRLNGDFALPTTKTGKALCRWIVQQQKAYHQWMAGKPSTMNEQRRDRLASLGVDWIIPERKKKKDPLSKVIQQLKDMT